MIQSVFGINESFDHDLDSFQWIGVWISELFRQYEESFLLGVENQSLNLRIFSSEPTSIRLFSISVSESVNLLVMTELLTSVLFSLYYKITWMNRHFFFFYITTSCHILTVHLINFMNTNKVPDFWDKPIGHSCTNTKQPEPDVIGVERSQKIRPTAFTVFTAIGKVL